MAEEMVAAARDTAHPADEVLAIHDAAERLAAAWARS
ncbi:MAG: hypothetical protein QOG75_1198, partial [Mycobacterium sp.]|nr:hypothetical protein [Mycobacterium sp.]